MQSNQPIESKKIRDARILLEILMQRDVDVQNGKTKPLKQAFAEHRERMKALHENILNNNHSKGRERY